jgi:hypothetical protein
MTLVNKGRKGGRPYLISMTQEEIGRLFDALQSGMSPTIVARIRELESAVAQAEREQDELQDWKHRHGRVPGA